ncbi:MAG TPA: hypothetical protein VJU87_05915 [Gemmatimonadaceae bacterium]|nr:hypothetical protein [Gemmatimonadaceae bacterium]
MPRLAAAAGCLALVASIAAPGAGAQIIRPPARPPEPSAWVAFSVGLLQPLTVDDGSTQSTWRFGNSVQYRVALEKPIQNQSSIGLTATLARAPLSYEPFAGGGLPACPGTCDADANITQLFGTFHAGGSAIGLHQVIELSLGATLYSDFRTRSGDRLPPASSDADLSLQIGYGFGYTLSPLLQIELVQDLGLGVHQRTGLSGGSNAVARLYTTRIGLRYGLGQR